MPFDVSYPAHSKMGFILFWAIFMVAFFVFQWFDSH